MMMMMMMTYCLRAFLLRLPAFFVAYFFACMYTCRSKSSKVIKVDINRKVTARHRKGPPSQKNGLCTIEYPKSVAKQGEVHRGQLTPQGAPGIGGHRSPDYHHGMGEFLNAPVTIVNGVYIDRDVLLVGWLFGHERRPKSRLNSASYLYT